MRGSTSAIQAASRTLRVRPKRSGPSGWSSRGCRGPPAGTKACGRTSSPTVAPGAADGRHPGAPGFLEGPLELDAEVGRHGGADGVVARDAEADADADLAVGLLEDVGLVAGRVHPGVHHALRRAQ